MAKKKIGPDNPTGDYMAMLPYWQLVGDMLEGATAMRRNAKRYLPKFPDEPADNYTHRCKNAKFTNIFRDIIENLAAKPFAKPVTVDEKSMSTELFQFTNNVDAGGTTLHDFAGRVFFNSIAAAVDYIFVDYTKVPAGATLAKEKAIGARPYWVNIEAQRMICAVTDMVDGEEQFVNVRWLECKIVREAWEETEVEQVREYVRDKAVTTADDGTVTTTWSKPRWAVYEKVKNEDTKEWEWVKKDNGELRINRIPLVAYVTGRRKPGTWQFHPPMRDAADLQVEHFQQETGLKMAKEMTCFPMLSANGVSPPPPAKDGSPGVTPMGPSVVLYAPMSKDGRAGSWSFVEPSASSLEFLSKEVDKTEAQLREVGRQPLTASSGNLTTIAAAVAGSKGNSAVQAWGLGLAAALVTACRYTAEWLQDTTSDPKVVVYTDFGIEMGDGTSMGRILEMRRNGDLPRETVWSEARRRGELSADFDAEKAKQQLADEAPEDPDAEDIEAAMLPGRRPPGPPANDPPDDRERRRAA